VKRSGFTDSVGVTGYDVYLSTASIFTHDTATKQGSDVSLQSYTITGLTTGAMYYVYVVAKDAAGHHSIAMSSGPVRIVGKLTVYIRATEVVHMYDHLVMGEVQSSTLTSGELRDLIKDIHPHIQVIGGTGFAVAMTDGIKPREVPNVVHGAYAHVTPFSTYLGQTLFSITYPDRSGNDTITIQHYRRQYAPRFAVFDTPSWGNFLGTSTDGGNVSGEAEEFRIIHISTNHRTAPSSAEATVTGTAKSQTEIVATWGGFTGSNWFNKV
jgi:hypothetical protein